MSIEKPKKLMESFENFTKEPKKYKLLNRWQNWLINLSKWGFLSVTISRFWIATQEKPRVTILYNKAILAHQMPKFAALKRITLATEIHQKVGVGRAIAKRRAEKGSMKKATVAIQFVWWLFGWLPISYTAVLLVHTKLIRVWSVFLVVNEPRKNGTFTIRKWKKTIHESSALSTNRIYASCVKVLPLTHV